MKKLFAVGIIILFVGACVVPSLGRNFNNKELKISTFDDGLVGYWKFDEGSGNIAYDSSGHNNNGTIYGANWTGGVNETALDFDGIDDYVDCGPTLTGTVLSQVTVETFIKVDEAGEEVIFFDGSDGEFALRVDANMNAYFHVKLSDGLLGYDSYSTSTLMLGIWYHLVGIYNYTDARIKIYVNGQLENTTVIPQLPLFNPGGAYYPTIGAYSDISNNHKRYFNGIIDEIRIYNRTLSDEEISDHYEEYFPLMVVYVDDDFNESTPGWGYDHFGSIQNGVDAVNENGTVYVYNGTYSEIPGQHMEYVGIYKSLSLVGENKNNTIINCPTTNDDETGIRIDVGLSNVNVSGFTIQGGNQKGIGFYPQWYCDGIFIEDCIIHSFTEGMQFVTGCSNITIRNCTTFNNDRRGGISFAWSDVSNFEISGCSSYSNSYGIYIVENVSNGLIYHNNFYNNTINAFDESGHIWNNVYPSGGNYWDDYTGDDLYNGPNQDILGSDGIGDTPYNISGGDNQDLYPLMHSFELYYILNISAPEEVKEGETFNVTITTVGGPVVPNASVEFYDTIEITDENGVVTFTAPQISAELEITNIIARKHGYNKASKSIMIWNIPDEYETVLMFGRIMNLSITPFNPIMFNAVNLRIFKSEPFQFIKLTSGENILIYKDFQGYLGALFGVELIFAKCDAYIG